MRYKIIGACDYKKGLFRENNEDNFYFDGYVAGENDNDLNHILKCEFLNNENLCFAVFDGVGGEAMGEKASYIGAKVLSKYVNENHEFNFLEYINKANNKILKNKTAKNMASTLCLISFSEDKVRICNLGDSRIYLFREGNLMLVSHDHTDKEVNKKLKISNNQKPRLMQYLGIDENELTLNPYIAEFEYKVGDKYLLCTDGLTDFLINKDINDILKQRKSPKEIVSLLMKKCQSVGTKDNTTIQIFEVKKKINYLFCIIFSLLFIVLTICIYFYNNRFIIDDQCADLVSGESCVFKFDDEKYDISIENNNVISFDNGKLIADNSGSAIINVMYDDKVVYNKKIKVFPKN